MRSRILGSVAVLAMSVAVLTALGAGRSSSAEPVYGFGVRVLPDEELEDFVQCGLSVFKLSDEEGQSELPSLRIMVGHANSMVFRGDDGIDVRFSCAINAQKTEVTYAVEGKRGERLVMNHLATVRFQ